MDPRTGIVTGRQTAANRGQGVPVRLLQAIITDPADVQTVQLVEQSGEESNPLNGTLVILLPGAQAFKLGVACSDGVTPVMDPGGKRIYSLDPTTAQPIAQVRLDPDGKITASGPVGSLTIDPDGKCTLVNGAASFTMNADGTFQFHGVSATYDCPVTAPAFNAVTSGGGTGDMTVAGDVVVDGDVTASGTSLHHHTHPDPQGGTTGEPA